MTEGGPSLAEQLAATPPAQRLALRDAARVSSGRRAVLGFVRLTHDRYRAGWVHAKICAELERFTEAVEKGESPRLIVTMPPRHGKTAIVSKRWPVWHLGRNPSHEIVCASYGQELADDNSRAARMVARSEVATLAFPDLLPRAAERRYYADYRRQDVDRVNHWKVADGGSYKAVGVGGPLTGRGAHVLIIDDPIKDRAEAESPTTRRKIYDWYTSTAYTRLAPGGGVLVMATRWHEDDLIGRLLRAEKEGGDKWRVISFPAIADADEVIDADDLEVAAACEGLPVDSAGRPCWRLAGEALHPARFPRKRLDKIRAAVGPRDWAALYQCRPTPAAGTLFERPWFLRRYNEDPRRLRCDDYLLSVDCSFKRGADTDRVVLQAWGWRRSEVYEQRLRGFYLLDQVRARMNYPETRQALEALAMKWPQAYVKLIEDKANGPALLDDLAGAVLGLTPFSPGVGSKYERAQLGSVPAFRSGDVWLPDPSWAPWIGEYIEEHAGFTGAAGNVDDQVDATSQALIYWRTGATSYGDALAAELAFLDTL